MNRMSCSAYTMLETQSCVTFSWLMFIESISRFCVLSHKTVCFCPFTDIEGRRWLISSCYCRLLKCLPGTWLQSRLRLYVYIDGKANVNVQHLIMQIDSGCDTLQRRCKHVTATYSAAKACSRQTSQQPTVAVYHQLIGILFFGLSLFSAATACCVVGWVVVIFFVSLS